MIAPAVTVRLAPPLRAMAIRITPAVPTTPKELPKAKLNRAGSKKATRMKVLGVMSCAPPQTKKATVPPARHRAVSSPIRTRIRSTFTEVFIPVRVIWTRSAARCPRCSPTRKKHTSPTSRAKNWGSPMTIQQATQARNTPNAAKRSTFFSPFIPLRPRWDTFSSRNTTIVPCRRSARSPPQGCQSRCVPPVCRHYSIFSLQCHPVFQHGPPFPFRPVPPFFSKKGMV